MEVDLDGVPGIVAQDDLWVAPSLRSPGRRYCPLSTRHPWGGSGANGTWVAMLLNSLTAPAMSVLPSGAMVE